MRCGAPVDDSRIRDTESGRLTADEAPEMVFDIRRAEGAEAGQLRLEQARVLREVTEWLAQQRSESGQDRAA